MKQCVISIIVPTYKEADNIRRLIQAIDASVQGLGYRYEIIIVDDDSGDGIKDIVSVLSERFPVRAKIRKAKRDLSGSVIDGLIISKGDLIAVMDADLSHPPDRLPDLLRPLVDGSCDMNIGSRFMKSAHIENFSFFRRVNAAVSRVLARPFARVSDPMSGFFAFKRDIISDYSILSPLGFKIGLEILVKSGVKRINEIPIVFGERYAGKSKLSLHQQFKYLQHLFRLFLFKIGHLR